MKRICDYPDDTDFTGFRVRGLKTGKIGTVMPQLMRDFGRETYWCVVFDGDDQHYGGWYWNDCEVEVMSEGKEPGAKWEEQTDCRHTSVMPMFDEESAKGLSEYDVRERWPRFAGKCPECGRQVILYASYAHYLMGDW